VQREHGEAIAVHSQQLENQGKRIEDHSQQLEKLTNIQGCQLLCMIAGLFLVAAGADRNCRS